MIEKHILRLSASLYLTRKADHAQVRVVAFPFLEDYLV